MKRAVAAVVAATCMVAQAQIYKCERDGKTTFTDEPCVGAKRIEVQPTQGLDKWSGQSKKGADVRKEEYRRLWDDSMRPLTGPVDHQQMNRRRDRYAKHLTPAEHTECERLDKTMRDLEAQEAAAQADDLNKLQADLFKQRARYRSLKC